MSWGTLRHLSPSVRDIRKSIITASDTQVLRILQTVEAMAERGDADELISPLRDRLNVLKPPRRLRFRRLLFYPLGPIIVAPRAWRPDVPGLPRSVVTPIANHLRSALPEAVARIEAEIDNRTTADRELIIKVGNFLWPAAAHVLASSAVPAGWSATGLPECCFRQLAPAISTLLTQAPALERICLTTVEDVLPPDPEMVQAIMGGAARQHAPALAALTSLLLLRLPDVSSVFERHGSGEALPLLRAGLDRSAEWLLTRLMDEGPESWIASGSLADAASALRRLLALLRQIEALHGHRGRRKQFQAMRDRLALACQQRFRDSLQTDLLESLLDTNNVPDARRLEATARELRMMEQEAHGLGGTQAYAMGLKQAADLIRSPACAGLALVARMRLVEILEDPSAALAMR